MRSSSFELERDGAEVRISNEKHYRLVDHDDLDEKDLEIYRMRTGNR